MKCLNLHAVGDLVFEEVDKPVCEQDEVLVKIHFCGVCGSDIPRVFTKGTYHFPTIIGHEFSGVVSYDPEGELEGEHVTVFPLLPCFSCPSCEQGNYASCENYDYYGSRRDGGMAEYIAVKRWNVVVLPKSVPLEYGAMCEPISVARHATKKLGDIAGQKILISGAGPIGLIAGQWCMAMGAKAIYYFDIDERKIEFAKQLGFYEYHDEKVDGAIEGTGVSQAFAKCLKALRAGGKITLMGNPVREMTLTQEEYWYILRKELVLTGTWNSAYNDIQNDWKDSVLAMSEDTLKLDGIITHIYKAEDYMDAFEMMRDRTEFYNKVMIEWDGEKDDK